MNRGSLRPPTEVIVMNRSRRNKLIIGLLIVMFVIIPILFTVNNFPIFNDGFVNDDPFVPSAVTAEIGYNVTYANVSLGANTTSMWETGAMNISDATNASFIETRYTGVAETLLGDYATDVAAYWDEAYRFKNLETVADAAIGATSIRSQFSANNGEPILRYDNGTSQSINLDTRTMEYFNVSVKGSATGSTLHEILFHNAAGTYYYLTLDQAITTSWVTLSGSRAEAVSVGGMTSTDAINWIDFIYTSPAANRWMYVDSPVFWNETSDRHLSVSFNFTGIAAYDHYTLNVSAATNTTAEAMQISDNFFEDAVYDIDSATWDNYTVLLNTTTIVANTFFNVFINSTAGGDRNSTLDIDLFQVYAWNETNEFPIVNNATLTNPDDTNRLYAGYRNYIFTLNISDADGFADIEYARIGFETLDGEYYWRAGFFEDNETFVEELYPYNITLNVTGCSNVSSGNYLNITFAIIIETNHSSIGNFWLSCFVNDTSGVSNHPDYAYGYRVEVDATITGALSDDRGDLSATLFGTGTVVYFNSTIGLASGYYDVWCYTNSSTGLANRSDTTIAINGDFNITNIPSIATVGIVEYEFSVRAEGEGTTDTDYSAEDAEDDYITDQINVGFVRSILNPSSEEQIRMLPVLLYEYDGFEVTDFDMTVTKNGIAWKAFDEANVSAEFWDAASGASYTYDTGVITDNTYDITSFSSISMTVEWYAGHGDGDGGVGDDDDWMDLDWLDLFGLPDVEDDPFFWFLIFLTFVLIMLGCISIGGCGSGAANALTYGKGKVVEGAVMLTPLTKEKYGKKKPKKRK